MTSFEIREKFLRFFESRGHKILPSSSLIPQNDPSLMFVNAGMNQFKNVFLGREEPAALSAATVQKCLRAGGKHNDLENVGQTPWHHTFFEMMGNFSFGSYFKEKAVALAWEFLTEELNFPEERLWVSVFKNDEESYQLWRERQNIPEHKIFRLGREDNFWQMGDTGPCGPCSEIYYDLGGKGFGLGKNGPDKIRRPKPGRESHVLPDNLTEIWNLVFMEFFDSAPPEAKGISRAPLPRPCIDTGIGFERLVSCAQGVSSNYHIDLFREILGAVEAESAFSYSFSDGAASASERQKQMAFRVVADHSRAAAFLIGEGVFPGSEGPAYVLRRIMRRAFYYSQKLDPKGSLLKKGAGKTISLMESAYPRLRRERDLILSVIEEEEARFSGSLKRGRKKLEEKIESLSKRRGDGEIAAKDKQKKIMNYETAKDLHATYGFPIDLTRLILKEKGWTLRELQEGQSQGKPEQTGPAQTPPLLNQTGQTDQTADQTNQPSRPDQKKGGPDWDAGAKESGSALQSAFASLQNIFRTERESESSGDLGKTDFTGYEKNQDTGRILLIAAARQKPLLNDASNSAGLPSRGGFSSGFFKETPASVVLESVSLLEKDQEAWLLLDKTCFYPEGGGPVGDQGAFQTETGRAKVMDCRQQGGFIVHGVRVLEGHLKKNQECKMEVDKNFREGVAAAHSATHLLNAALRKILGPSVRQAGSLVKPHQLRFDFSHPRPLTLKQQDQIEALVLSDIDKAERVSAFEAPYKKAIEGGALSLGGENYGDTVRVIAMGERTSKELCGGIHVKNTADIADFRIISETGVQSGVRRIVACSGARAKAWEAFLEEQNRELGKRLGISLPLLSNSGQPLKSGKRLNDRAPAKDSPSEAFSGGGSEPNPFLLWEREKDQEIEELKAKLFRFGAKKTFPKIKKPHFETTLPAFQKKNPIFEAKSPQKSRPPSQKAPHGQKASAAAVSAAAKAPSSKWPAGIFSRRSLLSRQNLELRLHLDIPFPKAPSPKAGEREEDSPFLPWVEKKEKELKSLREQVERLQSFSLKPEELIERAKTFRAKTPEGQKREGRVLALSLPLEDRKLLAEMADSLKSKIPTGVVALVGEGPGQAPVVLTITKDLQGAFSAGLLLKEVVAPLLKGKGGGNARFAQGSVADKSRFADLEGQLLSALNSPSKSAGGAG